MMSTYKTIFRVFVCLVFSLEILLGEFSPAFGQQRPQEKPSEETIQKGEGESGPSTGIRYGPFGEVIQEWGHDSGKPTTAPQADSSDPPKGIRYGPFGEVIQEWGSKAAPPTKPRADEYGNAKQELAPKREMIFDIKPEVPRERPVKDVPEKEQSGPTRDASPPIDPTHER